MVDPKFRKRLSENFSNPERGRREEGVIAHLCFEENIFFAENNDVQPKALAKRGFCGLLAYSRKLASRPSLQKIQQFN